MKRSWNMEWKGVLHHMDDLAKMIERDRETTQAVRVRFSLKNFFLRKCKFNT